MIEGSPSSARIWTRRRFLGAAGAAALAGCARRRPDYSTVVECYRRGPDSLDPTAEFSDVAHELFGRIYSGLLRYDWKGRLAPDLALFFETHPDRLRLTLTGRAHWHDGRPVVAADLLETFQRYRSPDFPFASTFRLIRRIDVDRWPDVELHLERPSFALLHALTARLLPAHVQDLDRQPIGCGFYRVASREAESLTLRRHAAYHGPVPSIEAVACRIVPDPMTQYLTLLSGDADVAELSVDIHHGADRNPEFARRIQTFSIPTRAVEFLFFNTARIPDVAIRQAVSLSLDRASLVRYLYWGHARAVASPFLDEEWAGDAGVPGPDFGAAARALEAAGFHREPRGWVRDGSPVGLTILTNADGVKRVQTAQVIAESLRDRLGIDARMELLERGVFERRLFSGGFECALYGFSFAPDPDDIGNLYRSDSDFNVSGYRCAAIDDAFGRARDLPAGGEKHANYIEVQRLLQRDLPSIPLLSYNLPIGVSRRLRLQPPTIIGDTYRFTREQNLWRIDPSWRDPRG